MDTAAPKRNRLLYCGFAAVVVVLGLLSRSDVAESLPNFLAEYSGDCLWALLVYLLIAILRTSATPETVAMNTAAFALAIELSQLYDAEWANRIRDLPGLRLVFGYGFLWSDLVCYATGIAIAWSVERLAVPSATT